MSESQIHLRDCSTISYLVNYIHLFYPTSIPYHYSDWSILDHRRVFMVSPRVYPPPPRPSRPCLGGVSFYIYYLKQLIFTV